MKVNSCKKFFEMCVYTDQIIEHWAEATSTKLSGAESGRLHNTGVLQPETIFPIGILPHKNVRRIRIRNTVRQCCETGSKLVHIQPLCRSGSTQLKIGGGGDWTDWQKFPTLVQNFLSSPIIFVLVFKDVFQRKINKIRTGTFHI